MPKAHVEAPTYASILLAGLLLKLGSAGLVRLLPSFKYFFYIFFVFIGIVGCFFASLIASFQRDRKSLVAFSRISHMSFVLLGLVGSFSFSEVGRLILMLAHGFISSIMFFVAGRMFHVFNSRKLYFLRGVLRFGYFVAFCLLISFTCNFSIPPSLGFLGESLIVFSLFAWFPLVSVILLCYIIYVMYFRIYFLINGLSGRNFSSFMLDWDYSYLFIFFVMFFNFSFLLLCI